MGTQASVQSIDALKDLRTALALYADDVLAALGGVDMEVRRTVQWVTHDRRNYWQEQVKRRRELVSAAQSEVFRRKLSATADYSPAFSEQKEILRKAQAALQDAESRVVLVRKWEPLLHQAALEYQASTRRLKDLAAGDAPRAVALLERLIDALEAYLRVTPPSTAGLEAGSDLELASVGSSASAFDAIAETMLLEEPPPAEVEAPSRSEGAEPVEPAEPSERGDACPTPT
jgi:hypothetical protein